jgi:nickel-dependent lactate racemase
MTYYYTYYSNVPSVTVPDKNLIGVFGPIDHPPVDRDHLLREAFAHPVNTGELHAIVKPEDSVLIIIDDALEPTPTVFPFYYVITELHKAGVKDSHITVLIANASHRTNTPNEVDRKIGAEMHRRFKVYQSAFNSRDESWHRFGTVQHDGNSFGVTVDARVKDATFIIGIAGTFPNRFKGFTGGKSLIFPGLGDADVTRAVYLTGASDPAEEVYGQIDPPARTLIRKLAEHVPAYKFCVEIAIDRTLQITSCVTGDPQSTFSVSADAARRYYTANIPEKADIVVVDSHPFDHNLFQAAHALYSGLCAMKDGGEIILVSPLLEELPGKVEARADAMKEGRERILSYTRQGYLASSGGTGPVLAALREVLERASHVTIVPYGNGAADVEHFGFTRATDVQSAFNAAMQRKGADARVTVIGHASLVVPKIG